MKLTEEQQAVLDGKNGETMAKVMETLVRYGELFKAERMVPVTGKYGHLVTSFGLGVIKPVYGLMDELIDAGIVSKQKFTMDPRPLDPNVPSNLIEDLVFHKFMYSEQKKYEAQLEKLGLLSEDSFSCACYFDEVGNKPKKGDILVYTGAKYGHVAIYAGGTTSYHQNMSGQYVEKKTSWNYDKSWYSSAEGGTKSYWGYIRPTFATTTYTDHIALWAFGFEHGEGNNSACERCHGQVEPEAVEAEGLQFQVYDQHE